MTVAFTLTNAIQTPTASGPTMSVPGNAIGTPSPDRQVAVFIANDSNLATTITDIAGVTPSSVVETSSTFQQSGVWWANVPLGTTCTIDFAGLTNTIVLAFAVGIITGAGTSPIVTSATFPLGISNAPSVSLNVPAGGLALLAAFADRAVTGAWTNGQTDAQTFVPGYTLLAADSNGANGSPLTMTYGLGGTATNAFYSFSAAGFAPAPTGSFTLADQARVFMRDRLSGLFTPRRRGLVLPGEPEFAL
jgi:hypothetical protein